MAVTLTRRMGVARTTGACKLMVGQSCCCPCEAVGVECGHQSVAVLARSILCSTYVGAADPLPCEHCGTAACMDPWRFMECMEE